MEKISTNKILLLLLFLISNLILSVKCELDEDTYIKALACVTIITERHKLGLGDREEPSIYSPAMLSCFIKITPDQGQDILTNMQQGSISIVPDEIMEFTNTDILGQYSEEELSSKSKELENAVNEFQKMEEDAGKFNPKNLFERDNNDNTNKGLWDSITKIIDKIFITRSTNNFWIALFIIAVLIFALFHMKNEENDKKIENNDIKKEQKEKNIPLDKKKAE